MGALDCRNDALVKVLNDCGYNPILLPRSGLKPPEIYVYDNDRLRRWGRLASAVPAGTLPDTLNKGEATDIVYKETSRKGLRGAASFLEEALKLLGVGGAPNLDLSFARGSDVTFSFTEVSYQGLDPADIGAALRKGFDPAGLSEDYIDNELIYIAYEYAYANSVDMTMVDGIKAGVDLKAIKLDGFVDLGGKADIEVKTSTSLTFKGRGDKAVFACKVGNVRRKAGQFIFDAVEVLGQAFAPEEHGPPPFLLRRGEILAVEDFAG
jgi:hypothetical protein